MPSDLAPRPAEVAAGGLWLVDVGARVLTAHQVEAGDWRVIGTYRDATEARIIVRAVEQSMRARSEDQEP